MQTFIGIQQVRRPLMAWIRETYSWTAFLVMVQAFKDNEGGEAEMS